MKRRLTKEDKEVMFHLGCHTCNWWDELSVAVLKGRALCVWCTDCGSEVAVMDMDEDEFSQTDELLKWSGCWMCYERLDHEHRPSRKQEVMFHLGCHTCNWWGSLSVAVLKGRALCVWCTDCGSEVAVMDMDEDEFSQADELLKWSGCWMCYERLDHEHRPTRK